MRNSKREEARIFINKAKLAAANTRTITASAQRLLDLDIRNPAPHRNESLAKAAERLDKASDAAMSAATSINPDRFENTDLWRDVLDAHHTAIDAGLRAEGLAKLIQRWLG